MKSIIALIVLVGFFTNPVQAGDRVLALPDPQLPTATADKGLLYLGSIDDNRVFEENPQTASTPSVNGQLNKYSKASLSTITGRLRNGFGKAGANFILPKNDHIDSRIRAMLETGFKHCGYTITQDKSAPVSVAVSIDKFWIWIVPTGGMMAKANIGCTFKIKHGEASTEFTILGYGELSRFIGLDSKDFVKAYRSASDNLLSQLVQELNKQGL